MSKVSREPAPPELTSAIQRFPALDAVRICQHAFITRIPGIDVSHDKAEALRRLEAVHQEVRASLGLESTPLLTAEQVHQDKVAVIEEPADRDRNFSGCDGLVTNLRGLALGIHVADCCAVYLVDPVRAAIGLIHSGRKGTELGIVPKAIALMRERFGSIPADMIVQLSPAIRPPHYEVDFCAEIARHCRDLGIGAVHDTGACTACDLNRYYSYRAEKGRTGRMLALLALK